MKFVAPITLGIVACTLAVSAPARSGTATFTDIGAGLTGLSEAATAWGDYDADGDLDIVVVGTTMAGRIARVYRNTGGTFADTGALPGTAAVSSGAVVWGDYDRDNDLDLAIAGDTGAGLACRIYRNTGTGFTLLSSTLEGVRHCALSWVDFDNDGDLDLAAAGTTGPTATTRIYRNTAGAFADAAAGLPGCQSCSMAWADYDLDGDHDLLLSGATPSFTNFTTLLRNAGGVFSAVTTGLPGARDGSLDWGDYDNDVDPDVLITGAHIAEIWRNTGGTFAEDPSVFQGMDNSAAVWGDYDNDGRLDIAAAGQTGSIGFGALYHNDGNGFSDATAGMMPNLFFASLAWGDYEKDGDIDLMAAGSDDHGTLIPIHRIYGVSGVTANTAPAAPAHLVATFDATRVTFRWDAATDAQGGAAGLTYNLWAGTSPGNPDVMRPMSNLANGFVRAPLAGNAGQNREWWLPRSAFPGGAVYWGVQAIDQAFAGSAFATAYRTLAVEDGPAVSRLTLRLAGANPSRTDSRLAYWLTRGANVDLAIHDLAGRRVQTLARGERTAGEHEVRWSDAADGSRPAPGLYFARLRADGETVSVRILRIE